MQRAVAAIPPFLYFLGAAAVVSALLLGGRAPGAGDLFPSPWDKLAHFAVFGGIAFALVGGFRGRRLLFCLLLTVLAGSLDELQQLFVPGRTASLADWLTNVAAAMVMVPLARSVWRSTSTADSRKL